MKDRQSKTVIQITGRKNHRAKNGLRPWTVLEKCFSNKYLQSSHGNFVAIRCKNFVFKIDRFTVVQLDGSTLNGSNLKHRCLLSATRDVQHCSSLLHASKSGDYGPSPVSKCGVSYEVGTI